MKKLLAILLAVAMLCTLSVSVFAANVIGGNTGVDEVNPIDSNATLSITANIGDTVHKYAIDIDVPVMSFNVTSGNLTWDVEDLTYVASGAGTLQDETFTVTVTNRSDLSVWYKVAVADADGSDGVAVDAKHTLDTLKTTGIEVVKANAETHTAKTDSFQITVKADGKTWAQISEYYAGKLSAADETSMNMATVTITFSDETF